MKDEQNIDQEHRRKAQNFQIHIHDEDAQDQAKYPKTTISSYSDPREAQKKRENLSEAAVSDRVRLAHELRNQEKGRKNKSFFRLVWLSMVLMASLLTAKYMVFGINDMLAVGRQAVNVTVEVPKNATSDQVAQLLYRSGVIKDVTFFKLYGKLTKAPKTYGGGSYQVTTGMDYEALVNSIQSSQNRVDTVKITFTEGMNALEVANKLEKNGVCSAKDALNAFNTKELDDSYDMIGAIKNASARYYKLEGYLFPDTYEFFKNEDPVQIVTKMVNNCNQKITKQMRDKAKEEGMTVDQMITLASMIQAEAADKDDMYKVSSVFHNRLSSKNDSLLHLDSDPTTLYPYRQRSLIPANIRSTYKSKYDTYTVKGLPAGAVCSPGIDAVNAALNPLSTDNYYFCHDKNGKAYYATTLSAHEANLKKAGLK